MAMERAKRGKDLAKLLVIKADRFSAQHDMWPNIQHEPKYQQSQIHKVFFLILRAGSRDVIVH